MANLTITALYTRKFLIGIVLLLVAILAFIIFMGLGKNAKNALFPTALDPPLVAFGKLPPIDISEGVKPPKNAVYKLETVTGDLEEQPASAKVIGIGMPDARFGDQGRANAMAESVDFNLVATDINGGIASYADKSGRAKKLTIELITGNITLSSDYLNNPELIASLTKSEDLALSAAGKFLGNLGLSSVNYPDTKVEYIKYRIDGGRLVNAVSAQSTNLIQVNFRHADIDNIPVVYPNFQKTKVWALASSDSVVSANANYTQIQPYKFSSYPLKGVQKAFSELKAGKGIYNKNLENVEFNIRDVELGYLDTYKNQELLQPVYVFRGDDGLAAYVQAVEETWVKTGS